MAIQYAGGVNVNTTIAADDRTTLVDNLKAELVNAGWAVASGSSGDWKLNSATTPAGHNMRVRLYDDGASNCAQVFIMNQAETLTPTQAGFLLPAASKAFIVIANKYQCFIFTPRVTAAREFVAFGVLAVPSFLALTEACWMHGNSETDINTNVRPSFRTVDKCGGNTVALATIIHNNQWSGTSNSVGNHCIPVYRDPSTYATENGLKWYDDSYNAIDAVFQCGTLANTDIGKWMGLVWDAFWTTKQYIADIYKTYDSKQFRAITDSFAGGSLMLYAP